jgi:hypothetical protein
MAAVDNVAVMSAEAVFLEGWSDCKIEAAWTPLTSSSAQIPPLTKLMTAPQSAAGIIYRYWGRFLTD